VIIFDLGHPFVFWYHQKALSPKPQLSRLISLSMKEGSLFCFVLFCSYEIH
jgi:hypothetical protein